MKSTLMCVSLFMLCASTFAQEDFLPREEQVTAPVDLDYELTDTVQICSIPLPVTSSVLINKAMLGTKHVYMRIGEDTFGTPFTDKQTYFGGDAYLYNQDPFFYKTQGKGETCFPVKRSKDMTDERFLRKATCLAKKLSVPLKFLEYRTKNTTRWYPVFDYHGVKNNCSSMVDYVVRCADGKVDKNFNFKVGGKVSDTKPAGIIIYNKSGPNGRIDSTYGEICELAKRECEDELARQ